MLITVAAVDASKLEAFGAAPHLVLLDCVIGGRDRREVEKIYKHVKWDVMSCDAESRGRLAGRAGDGQREGREGDGSQTDANVHQHHM